MANVRFQPVLDAIKRYQRYMSAGEVLLVYATVDTTCRITQVEAEGDYVILYGIDNDGNDAMLIQHQAQFSVRLVSVAKEQNSERGAFVGVREPRTSV